MNNNPHKVKEINIDDNVVKMRITTYLRDDVGERLKDYIEKAYGSRHGTLSLVIERAVIEFLDKEESKK